MLRDYRKRGPSAQTRVLIDALAAGGVDGQTVLDIGAGVGAVHQGLLAAGAASAVDVDASRAYVEAARDEARRRGTADRVRHLAGDFVRLASEVEPADIVALDRVVCCYEDMASLVRLSAERARRRYGLVFPKDRWWTRLALSLGNLWFALRRKPFRARVHRPADIDAVIRRAGLRPVLDRPAGFWRIMVYERPPSTA